LQLKQKKRKRLKHCGVENALHWYCAHHQNFFHEKHFDVVLWGYLQFAGMNETEIEHH
jgi:hypothetical protein